MRVLIDVTYSRRAPYSGTAVYTECLSEALSEAGEVDVVEVANPHRRPAAGGGLGSLRNLAADRWWTDIELPRLIHRLGADVFHHPLPALAPISDCPQVITVHDLAFERLPACFDRRFRLYAHLTGRRAAQRADAVICVSETTAADVKALWDVAAERIVVARHGPGQLVATAGASRADRDGGERWHFLYVGDAEPRKNLESLLAAYALYRDRAPAPLPLVLAGSAEIDRPGVQVERAPSPERLAALYTDAVALVQPSLYEGFGLTALEAMGMRVPVLAARSPGLVEVCGDAAEYFDPYSPVDLAEEMERIAGDPELRVELSDRGGRHALAFSWSDSAQAHLAAYRLAMGALASRREAEGPTLGDAP